MVTTLDSGKVHYSVVSKSYDLDSWLTLAPLFCPTVANVATIVLAPPYVVKATLVLTTAFTILRHITRGAPELQGLNALFF